jgi:hypothetical protein
MVLDQELKIDSGNFTIENVNNLMKLYSLAVEYYSGMSDEKYIFFTERIQNTLLRPEILRLMGERDEMEPRSPIGFKTEPAIFIEKVENLRSSDTSAQKRLE